VSVSLGAPFGGNGGDVHFLGTSREKLVKLIKLIFLLRELLLRTSREI
jgi:hypothetical protein